MMNKNEVIVSFDGNIDYNETIENILRQTVKTIEYVAINIGVDDDIITEDVIERLKMRYEMMLG